MRVVKFTYERIRIYNMDRGVDRRRVWRGMGFVPLVV